MQSGSMDAAAAVPAAALPDDVVAAILGRLLARSLAASRCVCKAWRDLVDDRGLLQRIRHLLPHSVSGIFVNYVDHDTPHFFARPTAAAAAAAGPGVDGNFSYDKGLERQYVVADHCSGLVLYRGVSRGGELYVCNPATRRWARLPPPAAGVRAVSGRRAYLAFSPAVSRHYQVLVAPLDLVPEQYQRGRNDPWQGAHPAGDAEWPPPRWTWHVFSSRSGRWRERVFARQGAAAGIVADLRMESVRYSAQSRWRYAVYRQGALYVHCLGEYVSRLSSSTGDYTYRVIKSPIDRSEFPSQNSPASQCFRNVRSYLGRSKGEVYFVAINTRRLRVWMLNDHESSQQHDPKAGSEWILKHDRVLRPDCRWEQESGPWILDDYYNWRKDRRKLDWSSDGDDDDDGFVCSSANFTGEEENDDQEEHNVYPDTFHLVGFHPYKEVIFLATVESVVAYHLSTSKVQYLGFFRPDEWNCGLCDSFVFTPCYDLRHRG